MKLSINKTDNDLRYAEYARMSDDERRDFSERQLKKTGLSPEQMNSIIHAPAIPDSSTVGNKQKRVYLKDIYSLIYKNDIKAIPISLDTLSCLDSPFLSDAWGEIDEKTDTIIPLTLRQLATKHLKRILEADLNYPIISLNRKTVLDGWHRVAKACYLGYPTIISFDINELQWKQVPCVPEQHLK